ncbi:MAG TPA: hypothetical protein VFY40_20450, partial [Blastocatellia bacterium]|nr:hypothetical protein [Blastocatellia bacterium]
VTSACEVGLNAGKRALPDHASLDAARRRDILIDTRQQITCLTLLDIVELVDMALEHRNSFRSKQAILARPGAWFDNAKFTELYADDRGFHVAARRGL